MSKQLLKIEDSSSRACEFVTANPYFPHNPTPMLAVNVNLPCARFVVLSLAVPPFATCHTQFTRPPFPTVMISFLFPPVVVSSDLKLEVIVHCLASLVHREAHPNSLSPLLRDVRPPLLPRQPIVVSSLCDKCYTPPVQAMRLFFLRGDFSP